MNVEAGDLLTVASILAGFGCAMLFFRVQRELAMHDRNEIIWLPWADWLLIVATMLSLSVILALFFRPPQPRPESPVTA